MRYKNLDFQWQELLKIQSLSHMRSKKFQTMSIKSYSFRAFWEYQYQECSQILLQFLVFCWNESLQWKFLFNIWSHTSRTPWVLLNHGGLWNQSQPPADERLASLGSIIGAPSLMCMFAKEPECSFFNKTGRIAQGNLVPVTEIQAFTPQTHCSLDQLEFNLYECWGSGDAEQFENRTARGLGTSPSENRIAINQEAGVTQCLLWKKQVAMFNQYRKKTAKG
jgi:hypothetical protein